MDIEGLGNKTVSMFLQKGIIKDSVADIYTLRRDDLVDLERFAEKSTDNLLAAIERSKGRDLQRFIYALGIPLVGDHMARVLADRFVSLEALMAADREELLSVAEVGPEVADSVLTFFASSSNRDTIRRLRENGVRAEWRVQGGAFQGMKFVFTGSLRRYSRGEIKRLMERLGAITSPSVNRETNFVVAGEKAGSKLEQARKRGVEVLGEEEFYRMLEERGGISA